jgi:hypothetical protein
MIGLSVSGSVMPDPPQFVAHDDRHLYRLATALTPAELAGAVASHGGSIPEAAAALGLDEDVVAAAVALSDVAPAAALAEDRAGALAALKDVAGLLAGVTLVTYMLGGAVLAARLAFENLPPEAVFGQIPREFLITIGVSQVLVPALLFAAGHAAGRALIFRSNRGQLKWIVVSGVLWWAAFIGLAVGVASWNGPRRDGPAPFNDNLGFWIVAAVVLAVFVGAAVVVRVRYADGALRWRSGPVWLTLTIAYGVVAMVEAATVTATFPLLDAKACTVAGNAERGDLVGQTSDHIFLGEPTNRRRRIAMLRATAVDELFVGPDAPKAACDPRGRVDAGRAVTGARRARAAAMDARRALELAGQATSVADAAQAGRRLRRALEASIAASQTVAGAAVGVARDGGARQLDYLIETTDRTTAKLERLADRIRIAFEEAETGSAQAPALAELLRTARLAQRRSATAAVRTRRLARRARTLAEPTGG